MCCSSKLAATRSAFVREDSLRSSRFLGTHSYAISIAIDYSILPVNPFAGKDAFYRFLAIKRELCEPIIVNS